MLLFRSLQLSVATATALSASPLIARDLSELKTFAITQYANNKANDDVVVLAAGEKQGVVGDSIFSAYRAAKRAHGANATSLSKDVWIKVGEVKAVEVHEDYSLGVVVEKSTPAGLSFFPKYPTVMAGDVVAAKELAINLVQDALPEDKVSYFDIFVDPKTHPESFEISEAGKQKLREMGKAFVNARLPIILVEGHTDADGPSDANQVESYQRALTVRQFLITELGLEPNRVVAVGFGENELLEPGYAPGFREKNRRIVLKAVESL